MKFLLAIIGLWVLIFLLQFIDRAQPAKVPSSESSKSSSTNKRERYIVYMGSASGGGSEVNVSSTHHLLLQEVLGNSNGSSKVIHSYHRSFSGFVAELTDHEVATIAARDEVISVFPDGKVELHTTRSWDFLGLTSTEKRNLSAESNVIIGVIDSGIWPESDSFTDQELGPPPAKWKGICQSSSNFSCNNKIIGARYYLPWLNVSADSISPRDTMGHGTHTASTAAGAATWGSVFGYASGIARGAAPSARLAVYKVCWTFFCAEASAILAAFDDAIADGVDILSVSLGLGKHKPDDDYYLTNAIAIGSFHAMTKGILTVTAAGNSGPSLGTLNNSAPWSLDVGATSIDRKFVTQVLLGNGKSYEGTSINRFDLGGSMYPLVRGQNVSDDSEEQKISSSCKGDSRDPAYAKGKIVVCNSRADGGDGLLSAGAVGYLQEGGCDIQVAELTPLPSACLNANDGPQIYAFINKTSEPKATISTTIERVDPNAPEVAAFSSRGPNRISPNILKPDIVAPGLNILAAWIPDSRAKSDPRASNTFKIASGTSMACPHVSGSAAYVKEFHPDWSPAAIRSALMTTATPLNQETDYGGEFSYGSGMLNPTRAADPGLVYDAGEIDYVKFLCSQGYTTQQLKRITNDNSTCDDKQQQGANSLGADLNYPSVTLLTNSSLFRGAFSRSVTNVGSPKSTYKVHATGPPSLKIVVKPKVLHFNHVGQKKSFVVRVKGSLENDSRVLVSGSIIWSDGKHQVRSPVVIYASSILKEIN